MRVLVLSGGGSHGAFEAGVIKSLVDKGVRWDAIAGVSVGALNAAVLCQFKKEEQAGGVLRLKDFWDQVKGNQSIYKRWFPFGWLHGLWKGSLYNTAPLQQTVRTQLSRAALKNSDVKLLVGAVCLETGEYVYVDGANLDIKEWVLASSAFPGAFCPIKIGGQTYVDGGVRDITPITDVLDMKPDQIDVVLCGHLGAGTGSFSKTKNVLEVGLRTAFLMSDEVFNSDLDRVPESDRPKMTIYQQPVDTSFPDGLDFNPADITRMYQVGLLVGRT